MFRLTWRFESPYLLRGSSLPLTRKTPCLREPDAFVTTPAGPIVLAIMTKYYHMLFLLLTISPRPSNGAPNIPPISTRADDALSTYSCNTSPDWAGPYFFPKDCATAISQFFAQEVLMHGNKAFEFLAVGAHPRTRYPSQNTPRKYTYGETTCT